MLKQSLCFLILSILVVFFSKYAYFLVLYIDMAYMQFNVWLANIFSHSPWGILARKVTALMLVPLIITGIPALIYRLVKKQTMPWFLEATWLIWLVLVIGKVLIR